MKNNRYVVRVSTRFLVLALLSSSLLAVAIGQIAWFLIDQSFQKQLRLHTTRLHDDDKPTAERGVAELPSPALKEGKQAPKTEYTAKFFDTTRSDINSRWIVTDAGKDKCLTPDSSAELESCRADLSSPKGEKDDDDDAEHLPQGQHLLMDFERVNSSFLNSEERLAKAMLDLVDECGLTLLSYHCHGLAPSGVSCAGVLLESHVSFHTWPAEGVITLDLFTCGDASLLPIVPLAEKLFSIPQPNSPFKPHLIWSHKMRGFLDETLSGESEATDFFNFPIGKMTDFKREIVSQETALQRVDIYDVLLSPFQSLEDYERSLSNDGSYQATHPELFQPDRIVFLDGVMQSRRSGDAAYHEALVHPALFAHPNPKRVAIIGGGEGATLREVLKHNTVEKVVMIDIDQGVVDLSREFLPDWNDCSMLKGSAPSCFNDPRSEVHCTDAFAWFIERFGGEELLEEPFDVIIMDALDPQILIPFVEALYDGGPFLQAVPKALTADGIFLCQVGEAPGLESPAEEASVNRNRAKFFSSLIKLGFQGTRAFEESRGGFMSPWLYYASFKSAAGERAWLHTESAINYKIRTRMLSTVNDESPLLFFDGAAMQNYRYPSRFIENVHCLGSLRSELCSVVEKEATDLTPKVDLCLALSHQGHHPLFLVANLQSKMGSVCDTTKKYFDGFDPASQRRLI